MAIVRVTPEAQYVLHLSELTHRGADIHARMGKRAAYRRNRRNRKTRYRPNRFRNRTRDEGWLQPSLNSRVDNVMAWVSRYRRWAPLTQIVVETVRFDTQRLIHPEIDETEYQQGTLYGYEVREYLLEKWDANARTATEKMFPWRLNISYRKAGEGEALIVSAT